MNTSTTRHELEPLDPDEGAVVLDPEATGQAPGDEQPRLPLDDKVKAFIDYLIDKAIEQWSEANASEAPE